jgi:hypothetical protein
MQEAFCYFVGLLVALWVTAIVAFPDYLMPQLGGKRKKFSGRHWGAYEDSPELKSTEVDPKECIEVGIPAKKMKYVVGGSTYAGGRGVSMRGG